MDNLHLDNFHDLLHSGSVQSTWDVLTAAEHCIRVEARGALKFLIHLRS